MTHLRLSPVFRPALGLVAAGFVLAGCSDDDDDFVVTTIGSSLNGLGLSTLAQAAVAAELDDDLDTAGPFTVFAPSNAAFASLPAGTLDTLLQPANQATLIDILERHVVTASVDSSAASALSSTGTLGGETILIDSIAGELYVNDARVVVPDVQATNGIVHIIDGVLTSPEDIYTTLTSRGLNTLVAAVDAAELDDDLQAAGSFTLLAPTDAAFAALPAGTLDTLLEPGNQAQLISLLQYHLISGTEARASDAVALELVGTAQGSNVLFSQDATGVLVNGVRISTFNIQATNGIVHVLDAVLTEPSDIPTTATDAGLTTLAGLLGDASLVAALSDPNGPFTVFAPTNDAFAALDPADLTYLTDNANVADLTSVLEYHVVSGNFTANDVLAATDLTTLEGTTFAVDAAAVPPTVGGIDLSTLNVLCSNGLVHTIDGVLIPASVAPNLPSNQVTVSIPAPAAETATPAAGPARELFELFSNDAQTLPLWSSSSLTLAAGWDRFEGAPVAALAPDVEGSAMEGLALVVGLGARGQAGSLGFDGLAADLRVDATLPAVPFEIVVQVAGEGLATLEPELRFVLDGELQAFGPQELNVNESGDLIAVWRPAVGGAAAQGFDLVLAEGDAGLRVDALRVLALQ